MSYKNQLIKSGKDNKEQAQKYYDTLVNKYPASPFTALVKTSPEQKEK
ncbi:hypothetical protein [Thermodesulfovibrio hydrogeniphilus]